MNKKQLRNGIYGLTVVALGIYFAYTKGWILADFKTVSPTQAQEMVSNNKEILLLDVRTPDEYAAGHIDNAILIPVQVLNQNLTQLKDAKQKPIIVYCASGMRSVSASRILSDHGYKVINMDGGMNQWKSDGLPVVR